MCLSLKSHVSCCWLAAAIREAGWRSITPSFPIRYHGHGAYPPRPPALDYLRALAFVPRRPGGCRSLYYLSPAATRQRRSYAPPVHKHPVVPGRTGGRAVGLHMSSKNDQSTCKATHGTGPSHHNRRLMAQPSSERASATGQMSFLHASKPHSLLPAAL